MSAIIGANCMFAQPQNLVSRHLSAIPVSPSSGTACHLLPQGEGKSNAVFPEVRS
jgi:hypothetical protein